MKKLTLILAMVALFATAQSQVSFTIDPVHPSHMNLTALVEVNNSGVAIGATFDYDPQTDFRGFMVDMSLNIWNPKIKNVNFAIYNGFSMGVAGITTYGVATAFYFNEQVFWKDFPIGLSVYQRLFMCNDIGVVYENRVGIVFNWSR